MILLSDCEAFGIPILEALASGTPVFLSRCDPEPLPNRTGGLTSARRTTWKEPLGVIEHTLARGPDAILEVVKDREALRSEFDWEVLAAQK